MEEFKSGFISIIGRTNVGKSTLLNAFAGQKLAIVANKNQTTRHKINAIINRKNSQIIFTDTPGIHKPKSKLSNLMNKTAWETLNDVDVILFVIEADSEDIGKGDTLIIENLKEIKTPVILVINKIDKIEKSKLLKLISNYSNAYEFSSIIPICARKQDGTEELLNQIEKLLKPGPAYYSFQELTDQTEKQIAEELIREKSLMLLEEEIPHGIYVEIEKMKQRKNKEKANLFDIEAIIYCKKKSHKGIIIGKEGSMLKKIGTLARKEIENMLDAKVNLQLWVKVKENWQDNENLINKLYNKN